MSDVTPPGPVSPDALRGVLDGRWAPVRREVREQLREVDPVPAETGPLDERRARVTAELRALAASGRPRLGFPKEHGGGGDVGGAVIGFEMLGLADLSLLVKAGVQWGLFGGAVQALGTGRHHRLLGPIMDLDLVGCFAMTETGHGSDVQHLETVAEYDAAAGEFVVHTPAPSARKDYIGNAARDGRAAVVFAQLVTGGEGHGVHALLVPIRDDDGNPRPGVTIEDCGIKAGLNGVDNGRLTFDRVRVPREALLNRFGDVAADGTYTSPIDNPNRRFFTMLGTLIRGRISVAGGAGAAAKTALALAVMRAERRRQFTDPASGEEIAILDYLAHQRRLLPALATTYALHFAQEELVTALHELQGEEAREPDERAQRELEARAAGVKAVATWHASHTIRTCREACGGAGYLAENRLAGLLADIDVFTTFEGDNTVLLQLVAKGLLSGFQHDVEDLGTLGMARFVAEQFAGAVIERTAARSAIARLLTGRGEAAGTDLLDRAWQLGAFEDREKHVLEGLARRLRRATEPDADPFAVFNDAQDHLLHAARVHVDRVVLEAFVAALERCPEDAAPLLGRVCDLYALTVVEADRAWFLEHGRISPAAAKEVVTTVDDLCKALRPHARTLVDAFGIPANLLDVPLLH
ncbi:acyl-CoA dehydrogenase family protein [Actinomadura parmotrematis]|uniref:Acyl-CoA dehydrogenase family protein n=1 Tax=Actinomadura parmotrematis TaxID=2864039 RepID=A0ABS7G7A8_9ACTN|nr:acyl-CoA dehydrogenase [Actinomadura parmotrematis]MBW8487508.1 acyl-CoA dehydrogenase family protein [Actinomadura parmotrematis]